MAITEAIHGSGGADGPDEHHHRNVQGGAARAAVFGISDGLVSNVGIILGVAGANTSPGFVRLAGLVALVGGSFSMAAGEYISMQAQKELLERELAIEKREIHHRPENERRELAALYRSRGIAPDTADRMATEISKDPDLALETHAREELGIDPNELGSPYGAAGSSLVSFSVGAVIPLLPWFLGGGTAAVVASMVLSVVAALGVGVALARFTDRSVVKTATRQLVVASLAAGVTFGVGKMVNVTGIA
jgi:VIT1/CCC1 family predicted Fe2+/Mn2+ transporter